MKCPDCGGTPSRVGEPQLSRQVSGAGAVDVGDYVLAECSSCALTWKEAPFLSDMKVWDELYKQVPDHYWGEQRRRNFELATDRLVEEAPRSVLDVGCFCGDFQTGLPVEATLLGAEFSEEAYRTSAARGVTVLGRPRVRPTPYRGCCDPVRRDRARAQSPLVPRVARGVGRPGGVVLAGTGDRQHLTWHLRGDAYYPAVPEHCSFVSEAWFGTAARRLGLELVTIERYRHGAEGIGTLTKQTLVNLCQHFASPVASAVGRLLGRPELGWLPAPWGMVSNHLLAMLRVPADDRRAAEPSGARA